MYSIRSGTDSNENNNSGADQTKQQLVNFIYRHVNLSQFKYDSLEVESELPQLISKTYYVSANFSGSNCLLVFAKVKDRFHTFLIDRKTLSYNPQKVNIKNVKITNVNIKINDVEIYQGTIFDGTFVQNKNDKTFIITDVYTFKGQDFTKSQLDSKLLTVLTYLKSNYNGGDKNSDLVLTVNKVYELDKIEHLTDAVIPKIKNFLVRGICFYPEISGTKLIFRFGNEAMKNDEINISTFQTSNKNEYSNNNRNDYQNNNSNNYSNNGNNYNGNGNNNYKKQSNNYNKEDSGSDSNNNLNANSEQQIPKAPEIRKITKTVYIPKAGKKDESYVFEMKKTDSADVYKLNVVESVMKDTKTYMKRKQICLAYIPNMNRSKWCKEIMESSDGNVLVNCKYYADKYKWEPVLISASKRPSFIDDFESKLIE